jgi:hypothetical protein
MCYSNMQLCRYPVLSISWDRVRHIALVLRGLQPASNHVVAETQLVIGILPIHEDLRLE